MPFRLLLGHFHRFYIADIGRLVRSFFRTAQPAGAQRAADAAAQVGLADFRLLLFI